MATSAPPVQKAVGELTALGKISAGDTALLKKVQKAAKDSPKQWQNYFWIAVGGEILFIPLIFIMAGFWDPRKANVQQEEHERLVDAGSGGGGAGKLRRGEDFARWPSEILPGSRPVDNGGGTSRNRGCSRRGLAAGC